jgi:hypothetical protein
MGEYPPYGFLNAVERIKPTDPLFPPDFRGDANTWNRWFNETVKLITDVLWPRFDRRKLAWVGPSAAHMRKLTDVDLRILRRIRKKKPSEFDKEVTSPVGALGRATHRMLFHAEDGLIEDWGNSYGDYDVTSPPQVNRDFVAMVQTGVDNKCADTDIRFKLVLQRPRAYQMAFILGLDSYDYEEAITANTPSICCGHCMQGLLGIGAIMEQIILAKVKFSDASWAALEQLAVDIGDRRVMAGVHYPSDALCSWLISLRLANHVYRTDKVKARLWDGIRHRSYVYKLIERAIKTGEGRVYEPAMRALHEEADRSKA